MRYSTNIYLGVLVFLCVGTIAIADDTSNRNYPPLPPNLQSVEPNRIANTIRLSAQVSRAESVLPNRDVVWVKLFVDKTGKPTSLKSVYWTVKDLWLEDVAEVVAVLAIENAKEQIENSMGKWFYQPVVFNIYEDNQFEDAIENEDKNKKSLSRSSQYVFVEAVPIHFEELETPKNIKRENIGKSASLIAKIAPDGKVMDAEVFNSSGIESLDNAALENASKNRFTPIFINGQRDVGWVPYTVSFHNRNAPKRSTSVFKSSINNSLTIDATEPLEDTAPMDRIIPVDVMPEMISEIRPEYPMMAKMAGLSGRVWIKALVGIDGRVGIASVVRSSGNLSLDDAAIKVAGKNLFRPGIQNGMLVAVWVTYKIDYVIQ